VGFRDMCRSRQVASNCVERLKVSQVSKFKWLTPMEKIASNFAESATDFKVQVA